MSGAGIGRARFVVVFPRQHVRVVGDKAECLNLCSIHVQDWLMLGVGVSVRCQHGVSFFKSQCANSHTIFSWNLVNA